MGLKSMDELISVVVPVYNVEQYLDKCIRSILDQDYKNIELILIDDGSTDGSLKICRKYEREDDRIKVLSQKNGGVVRARGAGIKLASGKYIGFVDGDDWIESNMYSSLERQIQASELAVCGYYRDYGGDTGTIRIPLFEEGKYSGENQMRYLCENMLLFKNGIQLGISYSLCDKLFVTEKVKNLYDTISPDLSHGEDLAFLHAYLLQCRTVDISHTPYYHYIMRDGSAVNHTDEKFLIKINQMYLALKSIYEKSTLHVELMHKLERYVVYVLCQAVNSRMGFSDKIKVPWYCLPNFKLANGTNVALYGAGEVGQDYYTQMRKLDVLNVVVWVDKEYAQYQKKGLSVHAVEKLNDFEYEYIIIAVKYEYVALSIKNELRKKGIVEDKILWMEPKGLV